jgi:2-iminobutanoate/2-iminopropanoate deaminase
MLRSGSLLLQIGLERFGRKGTQTDPTRLSIIEPTPLTGRTSAVQKQIIHTPQAPSSTLFSQAVKVGPTIYVSGIVGIDPTTNQMAGTTIQEQTHQALVNCENILRAAGATRENVVDVHVLLTRPGDFAGLNEAYSKFFPKDPPARAVSKLGVELPNVLVSIKLTAVLWE